MQLSSLFRKSPVVHEASPFSVPPGWIESVQEAHQFTPDMAKLERYNCHFIFLYGEEMLRHNKHNFLLSEDTKPLYTAYTYENFYMWKHKLGLESYPIATEKKFAFEDRNWFKIKYDLPMAKIKGELYAIPPIAFLGLDKNRANGVQFERKLVQLIIPYFRSDCPGARLLHSIKAWMYIGIHDYWEDLIDTGLRVSSRFAPVKSFKRESAWKEFYHFSTMEYKD